MNDEHPTPESGNQNLSDRELEIMSRLRENPELAEQIYALLGGEIGGPEDGREHSLDEMEENVVERARQVARQILEQSIGSGLIESGNRHVLQQANVWVSEAHNIDTHLWGDRQEPRLHNSARIKI